MKTKWTEFMDMHSGGNLKEKCYDYIYIEAPESEAKIIFYNRFGHSPDRVSCTCCGEDYAITQVNNIDPLKQKQLIVRAKDIKKSERIGPIPQQGYIWQD